MIATATTSTSSQAACTAPRDYLSFSAIRTYQTCPLRYFFRYVAGLPEETVSASLVFGGAIHRAVEFHFRELLEGNVPPQLDELMKCYDAEWREREASSRLRKDEDRSAMYDLARRILVAFLASDLAVPRGTILAVEEQLRGNVVPGLPDLLGVVDLVVETPQELVITDWKTSRSRWSREQVDDAIEQLLLYGELTHDFAPGKPVRIEFAVLTKTKEVAVDKHSSIVEPRRVARTKRVVQRVWKAIAAENFYPAPSPLSCGGCPFREPCRSWPG